MFWFSPWGRKHTTVWLHLLNQTYYWATQYILCPSFDYEDRGSQYKQTVPSGQWAPIVWISWNIQPRIFIYSRLFPACSLLRLALWRGLSRLFKNPRTRRSLIRLTWQFLHRLSLFRLTTTPWSMLIIRAISKFKNLNLFRITVPVFSILNSARISLRS